MPTVITQNWLTNLILPVVALIIISLSTFTVSRHGWFSVRPVLSTYIWFLAITSGLSLIIYLLQVPEAFRYTACRVYLLAYNLIWISTGFFSVAVLYEFLFRMADTQKALQRTAILGFVTTMGIVILLTFGVTMQTSSTARLEEGARLFDGFTALALLTSCIVVFAIKKKRSLYLEIKLSIVLAALGLYSFIDLIGGFVLRRNEQIAVVFIDLIWISFATLLYWALKNGPAISGPVVAKIGVQS